MTDLEIQCFEKLAKHVHSKGVEYLQGGNPCSELVAVLFTIEDLLIKNDGHSSLISALSEDLYTHDQQCLNALRDLGDDTYGY